MKCSVFWIVASSSVLAAEVLPPSEPTLVAPAPRAVATPSPKPKPPTSAPIAPTPAASPAVKPPPPPLRQVKPPTPGQLMTALSKQRALLGKDLARAKKRPNGKAKSGSSASAEEVNRLEVRTFYLRHREHVLTQKGFVPEPLGETKILFDPASLPYWIDGYGTWCYDF